MAMGLASACPKPTVFAVVELALLQVIIPHVLNSLKNDKITTNLFVNMQQMGELDMEINTNAMIQCYLSVYIFVHYESFIERNIFPSILKGFL